MNISVFFFFHVQIFLEIVNFGLHVTFTCRQKSLVVKMCQIWGCVRGLWWEKIHFDLHFLTPPSLLVTSCIQRAKRAASKIEAKFLLKKVTSYHDSGDRNNGTFPFWDHNLLGYLQGPENSHPFWKCRFRRWYLSLNEIERTVESEANVYHHTLVEDISAPNAPRQKKIKEYTN